MVGMERRIRLIITVILQQLTSIALAQSSGTTFFIWGNAHIVSLLSPSSLTFSTPCTSAFQSSRASVLVNPYASSLKTSSSFTVLNDVTSQLRTVSTRALSASPTPPSDTWSAPLNEASHSVTVTPAHPPFHHTTSTSYHSGASTPPFLPLSPSSTTESFTSPASIVSSSSSDSHTTESVSLHKAAQFHSAPSNPQPVPLSFLPSITPDKQTVFSRPPHLASFSSSSFSTAPSPFTPVTNPPSAISSSLGSRPSSFGSSGIRDPESGVFVPSETDPAPTPRSFDLQVLSLPEAETDQTGNSSSMGLTGSSRGSNNPELQTPDTSDTSPTISPDFQAPNIPDNTPSNGPKIQVPNIPGRNPSSDFNLQTPDIPDKDPRSNLNLQSPTIPDKDLSNSPKLQIQRLSDSISVDTFITEIDSLNDNAWSGSLGHFGSNDLSGITIPFNTNAGVFGNVASFLTEISPTTHNVLSPESSSSSSLLSPTFDRPASTSDFPKVPEEDLPDFPKSNSTPTSTDYALYVNQLTPRPLLTRLRDTPPIQNRPSVPIPRLQHTRTLPSGGFLSTRNPGQNGSPTSSLRGSLPMFNRTSLGFFDENSFGRRPDERTSLFSGSPGPWGPAAGPRQRPPTQSHLPRVRGLSLQKMEGLASIPSHFLPVRKMSFYLRETSAQVLPWLRLSGGRSPHEGRVEILADGTWGTICDQDFDFYDAQVVCRMLGYRGTAWAHRGAVFGPGEGPIWINGLDCRGNETNLQHCIVFGGAGRSTCRHESDAGVTCFHAKIETVDQDLALLLPSESCGVPTDGSHVFLSSLAKVVGGRDLRRIEMPWLVAIVSRQKTTYKHHCGAALISEDLVLTAAHCFRRHGHLNLLARVGDYWLNKNDNGQQDFEIETIFVNPKFDAVMKSNNDIALVKIKRKFGRGVKMGAFVQPICIPPEGTNYRNPKDCHAVGWGRVLEDQAGASDIPQVARADLYELDECVGEDRYALSDVTSSVICAGRLEGGQGVCRGDSGGPLTCKGVDGRYYLMGILSRVHGCGIANKPALFTRVTKFLRWIRDTVS